MNDKNNELQPDDSNSSQAFSRAERIMAIKNSIRSDDKPIIDSDSFADKTEKSIQANNSVDNDWESEISERIARRVQAMKINRENTSNEEDECEVPGKSEERKLVSSENDSVVAEEASGVEKSTDVPEKVNPKIDKKQKKKKKNLGQSLLGLLPQKKDKMSERIRKTVFLISCAAIVVCGYMVISYYTDTISTQNDYDEIEKVYIDYNELMSVPQEEEEEVVYPMFSWAETMLKQNKDLVGYITIPGSINDPEAENELAYPVVRSDDLEKYLNISFTGEEARAGTLFMDYRDRFDDLKDGKIVEENSDNLIIYGHNMQTGDMFGKLKNYRNNANYYGEHPVINLDSKYFHYQYKIFAFFIVDAEDDTDTAFDCWNYINFENEDEFYDYVNEAKKRTLRLNDVDVKYGDKLLTLSTCNSIFGNDGPGRLIIMARQVRENEDPYEGTQDSLKNPNIKWPSLYYKYNKNEKYDPDAEFIPYGENAESVTTNIKE